MFAWLFNWKKKTAPKVAPSDLRDEGRSFFRGNRNPSKYGFSIRHSSDDGVDDAAVSSAAKILEREPFYVDAEGYERELIAATIHPDGKRIAYVESKAKERGQ